MNPKLQTAYEICEQVVITHSSSFYRAFSVLPEPKRNAVWAVYAFCRTVDDLVDNSHAHSDVLVDGFEQAFDRMLAGQPDPHPHWLALAHVFETYAMEEQPFRDMIAGQRQDLTKVRYETVEELEQYCRLVAGTVGLMLLPILSPFRTPEMVRKAERLGIAMQITNVLRDVKEDFERGRVYLPQQLMRQYGYSEADIALGMKAPGWKPLFDHLAAWAEREYEDGLSAQLYYPRDSRLSLGAAGLIYRQILVESKESGGDVFSKRIRVSNLKKVSILLSLLTQANTWRKPAMASMINSKCGNEVPW
ncbi:phytoene/squalene synthase family protein [Paenibacillus sp. YYML68]|uniref:phytoene/squalene synthase family protein n=1 Tax=Paenibacillus sp. YYML68 TaxID=2909250 RepID=UPI0024915A1D|nr:phytoene/squalene synthase family protein [Paenibacillus sp. YYML68]